MARFDLIVGLPMTLILIWTISVLRNVLQTDKGKDGYDIADTSNLVIDILSSMNTSVDPCDNFYDFACQGWIAQNPIPSYPPKWSEFNKAYIEITNSVIEILEKPVGANDLPALLQAKNFYRKCTRINEESVDASDLQAMLDVLEEYGGWPILHDSSGNSNGSRFHWVNSTIGLRTMFSDKRLLNVMPVKFPSWRNKTGTIAIAPPLEGYAQLNEDSPIQTYSMKFSSLIVNISRTFLEFQGKLSINETYLEEKALKNVNVSDELYYLNHNGYEIGPTFRKCLTLVESGGCTTFSDELTLEKLQFTLNNSTFPTTNKLDIKLFLNTLYKTKPVSKFQKILVLDLSYFVRLGKKITFSVTDEELANYLHFQMVLQMIPLTGHKYLNKLVDDFNDFVNKPNRNFTCALNTEDKFSLALGQEYVNREGSTDIEFEMTEQMFQNIKDSIMDIIEDSPASYLNKSVLKLENEVTGLCLGYPKWMKENNSSRLQSEYVGLVLNKSSSYLEQTMALNSWKLNQYLELELAQENECKWTTFPGAVNPSNLIAHYLVYLPYGLIRKPFLSPHLPIAINYGKMGSLIGHEIAHSLVNPELMEFANDSLTPFSECLMNQFEKFTITDREENVTLNGWRTMEENISDNIGIIAAYKAFKNITLFGAMGKHQTSIKGFSDDQTFFLGFAQNWCQISTRKKFLEAMTSGRHSPEMFRVIGTLQNSKEFAEAWSCPQGSYMNPNFDVHPKCHIN